MGEEKTVIHCCVDKDIYDMLQRHCESTGQTKTTAIKRAIKAYCGRIDCDNASDKKEAADE